MTLTEKETKLIKHIIKESNFNFDELDLSKTWKEQRLENEDLYQTFVDINEYKELLETDKQGARGVLGSLVKKGLCSLGKDINGDNKVFWWVLVREDNFENIKMAIC